MRVRRWLIAFLSIGVALAVPRVAYANAISPYVLRWAGVGSINPLWAFPASLLAAFVERPFLTFAGLKYRTLVLSLRANFLSTVVGIALIPLAIPLLFIIGPLWYVAAFALSCTVEFLYLRRFDRDLDLSLTIAANLGSSLPLLGIAPAATVIADPLGGLASALSPHLLWLNCMALALSLTVFLSSFAFKVKAVQVTSLPADGELARARFEIPCKCGAPLRFSAGQAGTNAACVCGRIVSIPSLSDLQEKFPTEETSDDRDVVPNRWGLTVSILVVVALLFVLWFWNRPSLALLVFVLMFLAGKLWFLGVMFRETRTSAALVYIVPFVEWVFLFIRFDVAWKPVLLQLIGFLLLVVGVT